MDLNGSLRWLLNIFHCIYIHSDIFVCLWSLVNVVMLALGAFWYSNGHLRPGSTGTLVYAEFMVFSVVFNLIFLSNEFGDM